LIEFLLNEGYKTIIKRGSDDKKKWCPSNKPVLKATPQSPGGRVVDHLKLKCLSWQNNEEEIIKCHHTTRFGIAFNPTLQKDVKMQLL